MKFSIVVGGLIFATSMVVSATEGAGSGLAMVFALGFGLIGCLVGVIITVIMRMFVVRTKLGKTQFSLLAMIALATTTGLFLYLNLSSISRNNLLIYGWPLEAAACGYPTANEWSIFWPYLVVNCSIAVISTLLVGVIAENWVGKQLHKISK